MIQTTRIRLGSSLATALILSVTLTPPLRARQDASGRLAGVVVEAESHEPLPGAFIEILPLNAQARTDEQGRYEIGHVPPGRYTAVVRMIGRILRRDVVEIGAGRLTVLDVALEASSVRLPAIEVLRSRTELARNLDDIPGSVHVVAAGEITRQNPFHDVHQALRQVPGVNVQEEEGFGLRPNIGLRGTGSERSSKITLMEDGVLIAPAPYAAPSAYYFPVVGRMHGIEVRKGSSQIKYGPRTVGGAINLVSTPIPSRFEAQADLAGGEHATRRVNATVGGALPHLGWMVQGYRTVTGGFKQLPQGSTGYDVGDYNAKIRLHTDPHETTYQEVQVKVGYHRQRSDETYLGLTDEDFAAAPNRRYAASQQDVLHVEHRQLHVRHFMRPGGRFDLTTTLYRNDTDRNWYKLQSVAGTSISTVLDRPEAYPGAMAVVRGGDSGPGDLVVRANNRSYYGQGIQSVAGLQFAGRTVSHEIELGARYHEDQEDRFQHEDGFQMTAGRMVLTAPGAPGSQSNRVSTAKALALFIQDQVSAGRWKVTPGVRFETIDFVRTDYRADDPQRAAPDRVRENGVSVVIPGVGASYRVREALRVFGGVHRGFSPPGPGASQETEAETSINYELGFRYDDGGLETQLVGFFSDYRNILGAATLATGASGAGDQFNGGAVDVAGVELSVRRTPLGLGGTAVTVPWGFSFTYTRAEFRTSFDSDFEPWGSVERGDHLPYVPATQLSAWVGATHRRWEVRAGANYSAAMRTTAGQGPIPDRERTDAFVVVNASAEYTIGPWSTVYLTVQNLTDETHVVARRPAGVRPGLPRSILGGVRLRR